MMGPSNRAAGRVGSDRCLAVISGAGCSGAEPPRRAAFTSKARCSRNVVASIHSHYIDSMAEGDLPDSSQSLVGSLRILTQSSCPGRVTGSTSAR